MSRSFFSDYYEILQVSRNADAETIDKVYRILAKRYHPDNGLSGDLQSFNALLEAHEVLSDPAKRADYDRRYDTIRAGELRRAVETSHLEDVEEDRRVRLGIIAMLYTARRHNSNNPGVGAIQLEEMLGCSRTLMNFHIWYLKEKKWIQLTDTGLLAITAVGVDALLENESFFRKDRLLPDLTELER